LGVVVNYAQNITDVDDPLIERAIATGRDWQEIAIEQTELFRHDMEALRVVPPTSYIGAVESIDLVVRDIHALEKHGAIYQLENDYYYDIKKARLLGQVAHLDEAQMNEVFAERGGDPQRPGKRHPLDALVWRGRSGSDPYWASDLGEGRPGWHIECAAIALEYLGSHINVQGGGSDLKFPHHEMSAAHAETATGIEPFADVFMHTGMVALDGQKMSKSLGNLVFVSKLRAQGVDPMAIRLTILSHHYRGDWEWFDTELEDATTRLEAWRLAFGKHNGAANVQSEVLQALCNDLDTPSAIRIIDQWCEATNNGAEGSLESPSEMADCVDALLGIR